jgi:hypothetical protein
MIQALNDIIKSNEEEEIQKALMTPYEKALKILKKVVIYLGEDNILAKEVNWVIKVILNQQLYSYEILHKNFYNENTNDLKLIYGFLSMYSQKDNFNPNIIYKRSQTVDYHSSKKVRSNISSFLSKYKKTIHEHSSDSSSFEKNEETIFKFKDLSEGENEEKSSNDKTEEKKEYKDKEYDLDKVSTKIVVKKKSSKKVSFLDNKVPKKSFSSNLHIYNINNLEAQNLENNLFSFEFNVFDFYEKYKFTNPFTISSQILLQKYDIIIYSDSETVYNFLKALQEHYTQIAIYHTEKHAIDMLQTLFIYLYKSRVIDFLYLNKLDILSLLVAGVCHDVGHKGYNNDYQIKMYTDLAITYNDKSILENFHISETFKLLKNDKLNIFRNTSKNDFSYIRKRIIDMILATDMFYHSRIIALMKSRLENKNIKNGEISENIVKNSGNNLFNEQQEILNYLIHIGDISHNTKKFEITYKWSLLLTEEFWRQGDEEKEKGFNVNFLYDRNNIDIGRNQVGFIKGIIVPSFDLLINFLPELMYYSDNMKENLRRWNEISEELNKKKNEEEKKLKRERLINKVNDSDDIFLKKVLKK